MVNLRRYLFSVFGVLFIACSSGIEAKSCPHPPIPVHAQVELSVSPLPNSLIEAKTIATYKCDEGYELFGPETSICSEDGKWSEDLPYCAVNVAYGKPAKQSSTARGGDADHANDGYLSTVHENKHCTQTRKENSPWWMVDLLQSYTIKNIRILTRGCCGHDHLQDIEIRVGNSSQVQGNRLCAWYPGTLDDGITKDFNCARPLIGRYVFIQMVGIEGSLSVCEVSVFTTQEFSANMCAGSTESENVVTFNKTCFEFQVKRGNTLDNAEKYCKERRGHVVNEINKIKHNFITSELNRLKSTMKTQLVWIGARRQSGIGGRKWRWLNSQIVNIFLWGKDQPNNYNGEQNCVVLDGGRRWSWNDVSCKLDYLPWICQYKPLSCGSPDKKLNSTIIGSIFSLGKKITYQCPVGNALDGSEERTCLETGLWNGMAPTCKYVDCGILENIENGKVSMDDDRTTYNATATYSCNEDYIIIGNESRKCLSGGRWDKEAPKCLYNVCPKLENPVNGTVAVSSQQSGGKGVYSCNKGSKLFGNLVRQCKLGGMWSGSIPRCKYIDCRKPKAMKNGHYNLVEDTTYFGSNVLITCAENYTLTGPEKRTCLETGKWSGYDPSCDLINCGEPDQLPGSFITASSFNIYSNVKYKCEPGHIMKGDDLRHCGKDGRWTGKAPFCEFINCGKLPPIPRGEVFYMNESTHLGSVISYKCIRGFQLSHNEVRICQRNGRWSSSTPKCQEIRCLPPDTPANATLTYGNNDRSTTDSFKIGSTAQYRCVQGYSVQGKSLRTCESNGYWSGQAPYCVYVDCGYPEPIYQGFLKLTSNTTYYGSTVEYGCIENHRLQGASRRLCLENGAWSHHVPSCTEIKCNAPDVIKNMIPISGILFSVEDKVDYKCLKGYRIQGNNIRNCQKTGYWTENIPECQIIDCGSPKLINNGIGDLINGTMTYRSVVKYECLQGFQLIGNDTQICEDSGKWSGQYPRCAVIPDVSLNEVDSLNSGQNDVSDDGYARNVGIGVGISIGALLLVIIIVAVVCMRTRKEKPVKNTENVETSSTVDKDPALVTAYNRIDPNSVPQRQGTTVAIVTNGGRDNPVYANNSVANRPPSNGVYANLTINGRPLPKRPDA